MTNAEVIRGMLDLLDAPEKWTKHAAARTASGKTVASRSPDARSWCLSGAFYRVTWGVWSNPCVKPEWWDDAAAFLGQRGQAGYGVTRIPVLNDRYLKSYEDMRLFLKRALVAAEEEE